MGYQFQFGINLLCQYNSLTEQIYSHFSGFIYQLHKYTCRYMIPMYIDAIAARGACIIYTHVLHRLVSAGANLSTSPQRTANRVFFYIARCVYLRCASCRLYNLPRQAHERDLCCLPIAVCTENVIVCCRSIAALLLVPLVPLLLRRGVV